jgi:hypothetical protein
MKPGGVSTLNPLRQPIRGAILTLGLLAAALLQSCSAFQGPEDTRHDRYVFEAPEQVVTFVYQSLASGRYGLMQQAFLNYADKRPWVGWQESDQPHPWTRNPHARAQIIGLHEQPGGDVVVVVRETWSGGEKERTFRCHLTTDGWHIQSVEGTPGDGLLGP